MKCKRCKQTVVSEGKRNSWWDHRCKPLTSKDKTKLFKNISKIMNRKEQEVFSIGRRLGKPGSMLAAAIALDKILSRKNKKRKGRE